MRDGAFFKLLTEPDFRQHLARGVGIGLKLILPSGRHPGPNRETIWPGMKQLVRPIAHFNESQFLIELQIFLARGRPKKGAVPAHFSQSGEKCGSDSLAAGGGHNDHSADSESVATSRETADTANQLIVQISAKKERGLIQQTHVNSAAQPHRACGQNGILPVGPQVLLPERKNRLKLDGSDLHAAVVIEEAKLIVQRNRPSHSGHGVVLIFSRNKKFVRTAIGFAALNFCLVGLSHCTTCPKTPDLENGGLSYVIFNARIDTTDTTHPDALAVAGKKIVALGKSALLRAACASGCTPIDAEGGFLQAGFNDTHVHLALGGLAYFNIRVVGSNLHEIGAKVAEFAQLHREKHVLIGSGWSFAGFAAHLPTREDLDRVEPTRPVVLDDSSGHNAWANSAAIAEAGIDEHTPDPPGGKIFRNPQTHRPTGIFLGYAATLLRNRLPPPTNAELERAILKGEELSLRAGFTSAQGGPVSLELAQLYAKMESEGKLKQRVYLWGDLQSPLAYFQKFDRFARSLTRDGKVIVSAFKGFVDGALVSHSAALLQPYADRPHESGEPNLSQSELNTLVLRANAAGYPVALHAIGDRAVRMALDAYENSLTRLHHQLINRVEHASLVDPKDLPRFHELHVVASVQPNILAQKNLKLFLPNRFLGAARALRIYAWGTMLKNGATLIFGTDFPTIGSQPPDPLRGLLSAETRKFADGSVFSPEERLDGDVAFAAYTSTPAWALGLSDRSGRIAVGYDADLIVLTKNPREAPAPNLSENPLRLVMVQGVRVVP